MADAIEWPVKTREINDAYFESARWNGFRFREGDVVIATYPKVGTNWTQQIAWQLVHGGPPGVDGLRKVAWLDMRIAPFQPIIAAYEAQTDRRILKTHLPLEALVFSPKAKYIVVGRDARDMVWSAYNHQSLNTDEILALFNGPPGRPGARVSRPDRDIRDYYMHFLAHDELPRFGFEPFWPQVRGWWAARKLPNVLLVHYANLKADLAREIRRMARFLAVELDAARRGFPPSSSTAVSTTCGPPPTITRTFTRASTAAGATCSPPPRSLGATRSRRKTSRRTAPIGSPAERGRSNRRCGETISNPSPPLRQMQAA
jgi:aryl sulfotransferase